MVVGTNGLLYGCGLVGSGKGLYQECEQWVRRVVQLQHGLSYTGNAADNTYRWLINELGSEKVDLTERLPGGLVNVRNGMLNPLTGGPPTPHNCSYVSICQIPVNWNPDAKCPAIDQFLQQVAADEDTAKLIWEMIGYILFGNSERQKAFLLRGPGGNGKSVLLWLLTNLIGRKYVQVSSLNDLCDNKFRAAGLYGKKANICGDIGTQAVKSADVFKRLTGTDEIEVEHKNRDPFKFLNKAVLVFSANSDPKLLDRTKAVEDRWIMVSMPNTFRGVVGVENPHLFQELTTKDELEGALLKAALAYQELEQRNSFTIPVASLELKRGFKASNSSALDFYYECLVETQDESQMVERLSLHSTYTYWMEANDPNARRNSFKNKKFLLELERELGPLDNESHRISNTGGKRYVKGLKWSEEGLEIRREQNPMNL